MFAHPNTKSWNKINDNLTTPLRIASVRVEGAVKTRKSFLATLVTPFLPQSATPFDETKTTLGDVLHTTRHIGNLLQETEIFQAVEAKLETSRDPLAQAGDVDIVFKTREKGRFYLNTSTQLGNNEGGAVCSFSDPSLSLSLAHTLLCRVRPVAYGTRLGAQRFSRRTLPLRPKHALHSMRLSPRRSRPPSRLAASSPCSASSGITRASRVAPRGCAVCAVLSG